MRRILLTAAPETDTVSEGGKGDEASHCSIAARLVTELTMRAVLGSGEHLPPALREITNLKGRLQIHRAVSRCSAFVEL